MRRSDPYQKPTAAEVKAAAGKTVPDVIAPGLRILFCGINPGLYSGAVGHHFARPGNRFWKVLHEAGITPRRFEPWEEDALLEYGCGITNLVERATASASELGADELRAGRRRLESKVDRYAPAAAAVLGVGAYRKAFGDAGAAVGWQPRVIAGSVVWVLPNPSGINASYQMPDLTRLFKALKKAAFDSNAGRKHSSAKERGSR